MSGPTTKRASADDTKRWLLSLKLQCTMSASDRKLNLKEQPGIGRFGQQADIGRSVGLADLACSALGQK